jgi:hypothetical protein
VLPVVNPVNCFVTRTSAVPDPIEARVSVTSTDVQPVRLELVPQQKLAAVSRSAPGFISAFN